MTTVDDLERRVTALEGAQNDTTQTLRWVVAKLGRMSAVQDEHTLRLERMEGDLKRIEIDVKRIEGDLRALRQDLPGIVAGAVRDGLTSVRES